MNKYNWGKKPQNLDCSILIISGWKVPVAPSLKNMCQGCVCVFLGPLQQNAQLQKQRGNQLYPITILLWTAQRNWHLSMCEQGGQFNKGPKQGTFGHWRVHAWIFCTKNASSFSGCPPSFRIREPLPVCPRFLSLTTGACITERWFYCILMSWLQLLVYK